MNAFNSEDWRERNIREWLLLILRFAITREPRDRFAVYAMADELDAVGLNWRPAAPRFFARTAGEVCDAILEVGDNANVILRTLIARIGDPRLRGALAAAVDLDREQDNYQHRQREQQSTKVNRREALDLWRGLSKNDCSSKR
jgi:hypothetical protein